MFSVTDSGVGMDAATRERIFEPFYTTKDAGKGTGLGLSTVHGIVEQNGGTIWVYSEPNKGTTFKVYLPRRMDGAQQQPQHASEPKELPGGSERIFVVEDDEQLRVMIVTLLGGLGYAVSEAGDGEQALARCRAGEQFELILSDVIMPKLSGPKLLAELRKTRPQQRALFMSGYLGDALPDPEQLQQPQGATTLLISKPFTIVDLVETVRAALDGEGPQHAEVYRVPGLYQR